MPEIGKKRRSGTKFGYGHILSQGLIICLLLMANGYVVRMGLNLNWLEEVRVSQAIQLVLPVGMIFVELWLFDFLFAASTRNQT